MKGADHSCHVKQRAAFNSAFAQRPRRLAMTFDYYEVVSGMNDLAEVVIAVASNPHDPDFCLHDSTKAAVDLWLEIKDLFCILLNILRQLIEVLREQCEVLDSERAQALVQGTLVL